jgi:hypothetical protein
MKFKLIPVCAPGLCKDLGTMNFMWEVTSGSRNKGTEQATQGSIKGKDQVVLQVVLLAAGTHFPRRTLCTDGPQLCSWMERSTLAPWLGATDHRVRLCMVQDGPPHHKRPWAGSRKVHCAPLRLCAVCKWWVWTYPELSLAIKREIRGRWSGYERRGELEMVVVTSLSYLLSPIPRAGLSHRARMEWQDRPGAKSKVTDWGFPGVAHSPWGMCSCS